MNQRGRVQKRCLFEQQHGDRIGFLTRRTPHRPYPHAIACRLACEYLGNDHALDVSEHFGVTEEARDRDEKVLGQSPHLFRLFSQQGQVVVEFFDSLKLHPASDAAHDGGPLVVAEVVAGSRPNVREDALQQGA